MSSGNSFVIEIGLEPTVDQGSASESGNETPNQVQRREVVDSVVTLPSENRVAGYLEAVIHGRLDGLGSQAATLIVARFRFLSSSGSRNFRTASIQFTFKDPQPSVYAPEVSSVAPDGHTFLCLDTARCPSVNGQCPWMRSLRACSAVPRNVENNKPHPIFGGGALIGSPLTVNRNWGPSNAARWTMGATKAEKSGIPVELRVAMLLKRQDDQPFVAEVGVTATVDWLYGAATAIRKLRGRDVIDPINFDPKAAAIGLDALPPGTSVNNLSRVVLANLCQIGPANSKGAGTS